MSMTTYYTIISPDTGVSITTAYKTLADAVCDDLDYAGIVPVVQISKVRTHINIENERIV